MEEKQWKTANLLEYIESNYILRGTLEHQFKNIDHAKYRRKIRRVIENDLREAKEDSSYKQSDYKKVRGHIVFTEKQAQRFLNTDSALNDYFLREMAILEGTEEFNDYFAKYTDMLNQKNNENLCKQIEDLKDRSFKYTDHDLMMSMLIKGIFGDTGDQVFSYFDIDCEAYKNAYEDMKEMVSQYEVINPYLQADKTAQYPYNRSYGYHFFKLSRPLIYFRKDNYYLKEKPYLKEISTNH